MRSCRPCRCHLRSDALLLSWEAHFAYRSDPVELRRWEAYVLNFFSGSGPPLACALCEAYVRKFGCHLLENGGNASCPATKASRK